MTRSHNISISWRGSELRPNGGDSVRHAAGDELLIFRRTELRYVSRSGGNLNRDGSGNNIIQWAERRCKHADWNLLLPQLRSHTRCGGLAEEDGRLLSRGPGAERAAVLFTGVRKQRGVEANAVPVRRRMQCDIDGGVRGVGEKGALLEREVGIGIAQNERRDSAILQFLPQAPGECYGHVFLGERGAERLAAVIAAVARVYDREVTAGGGGGGAPWPGRGRPRGFGAGSAPRG